MKAALYSLVFCGMVAIAAGCKAPNPYLMPIDGSGLDEDIEASVLDVEKARKVAVLVFKGDQEYGQFMMNALYAKLTEEVGALAFFELVERGGLDALRFEEMLSGDGESVVIPADYVISASISSLNVVEQTDVVVPTRQDVRLASRLGLPPPTAATEKRFNVAVVVDFRFYQKATRRVILTKTIRRDCQDIWEGALGGWLTSAAHECATEFARSLGARYAPEARVKQTRGGYQVAWISIGTNYGLSRGAEVNFFDYVDNSSVVAGAKRDKNIIGVGRVLSVEDDSAWVEVFDYDKVRVRKGAYVACSRNQERRFRWRDFFRYWGDIFTY